ncbi:MAG TPA: hypothetical protein VFR97_13190 [Capillimicrobium sp.]|nr:hypothetical protein [Capillimicrobium sp.]
MSDVDNTPPVDQSPFQRSVRAAVRHVDPESIDAPGTTLMNQVVVLQAAARLLTVNYRWFYENETDGWQRLVLFTESLYQQIHAVTTTASILLARRSTPPLGGVDSLHRLLRKLENLPGHPVAVEARRQRRALTLLKWLCDVRNIALQHRAERGLTGNRGHIIIDGFALLRTADPVDPAALRKARTLFAGFTNRYGEWNERPNSAREALTYLDLGSHELYEIAPGDYDRAREVVAEAACYDLVVSVPVLENADTALSVLLEMIPDASAEGMAAAAAPTL